MPTIPEAKRIIPPEVLDLPVGGPGIEAGTLRELIDHQATVLAFLRHFG